MEIPYQNLNVETLNEVIKDFVLREGTDYGHSEWTLSGKTHEVLKQLKSGQAILVFDKKTESCSIIKKIPLTVNHAPKVNDERFNSCK